MPSFGMLMNRETLLKLKAGTISKDEIIDGLIGSTPLKQISRSIDTGKVRWWLGTTADVHSACKLRLAWDWKPSMCAL